MEDITVVGSNMIDMQVFVKKMPLDGETVEAPDFSLGYGGKGSNQAVAASRLGSDVNLITVVGNDDFGKQQLKNYKKNNINTKYISIGNTISGVAPIFVKENGENSIIIVKGANNELTPKKIREYKRIIGNSKLVILQQEIPLETNNEVIKIANYFEVPVLLNPAPASDEISLNNISRVQFYAPNETELARITNLPTSNIDEIKIAAQKIVDVGVDNVIVTMGGKGALLANKNTVKIIPSQKVNVVDTTGAGDAFIGSFAHYYTQGQDIETALRNANIYASLTIMKRGTQKSYLTSNEVAALQK
ncbi:ribokinase [Ligilactobacillus acidipiscis]|uniref:ribokinase n=1 Tax=Ligilactobacillus acidipiscis TaxID=89059 RepID=UPI0022DF8E8F|nr:ribokinase [Ligilactobacillus acidipiscis]